MFLGTLSAGYTHPKLGVYHGDNNYKKCIQSKEVEEYDHHLGLPIKAEKENTSSGEKKLIVGIVSCIGQQILQLVVPSWRSILESILILSVL